jgi:hypothetical protein
MQSLAQTSPYGASTVGSLDDVCFILDCNGWEAEDFPLSSLQDMADEVILVQVLHDDDYAARSLLLLRRLYRGVLVPLIHGVSLRLRHRFIGLQRIVNDHEAATSAREDSAHRGRQSKALCLSHLMSSTSWKKTAIAATRTKSHTAGTTSPAPTLSVFVTLKPRATKVGWRGRWGSCSFEKKTQKILQEYVWMNRKVLLSSRRFTHECQRRPRAKPPEQLQDSGKGDCSGCGCGFRLRTNAEISVMTSPIGKGSMNVSTALKNGFLYSSLYFLTC